ncbi:hypothetical protein A3E39_02940 [Candidatus Uhrbacteria bacterium RIFCSPHIGHO2_12_FULL_60_25]|uniref:Uncharacterized protein n=1 Tax=Candidatus Uhrbacteria bacterium RIFCSPHIGHO2_12_FULL_60_25 TaxID=1802399 RepID=A0A1F7UIV4_9BACT|nr:MAG: hypothetical protein A3D73_01640 [Candidatus Uhrbacteria bacterium RIFCSPHIGHO2_02_FULL_60_44]OGL78189.1 MAG: hypothetical protein A3E39_02940 [Candidatus Uhrbacteria bacterium RIFCSPHIGHO2_12_FULL_60_25]
MTNGLPGAKPAPEKPVVPVVSETAPSLDELSTVEADELARESLAETQDDVLHAETKSELEAAKEAATRPGAVATGQVVKAPKDETIIEVEKVLEQGIGPFYSTLPAEAKALFRKKGEEAATEIAEMVRALNVKVKRVLELIYAWLKTIPGVNKFFLEQEAKIKTDRIVELVEAMKEEREKRV